MNIPKLIENNLLKKIEQLKEENRVLQNRLNFLEEECPFVYAKITNDSRMQAIKTSIRQEIASEIRESYEEQIKSLREENKKLQNQQTLDVAIAFAKNPNCKTGDFFNIIENLKNGKL